MSINDGVNKILRFGQNDNGIKALNSDDAQF